MTKEREVITTKNGENNRRRFYWTVSLGDILRILTTLSIIVSAYYALRTDIVNNRNNQEQMMIKLDATRESLSQFRSDIREWESSMFSDLGNRIERNEKDIRELRQHVGSKP